MYHYKNQCKVTIKVSHSHQKLNRNFHSEQNVKNRSATGRGTECNGVT